MVGSGALMPTFDFTDPSGKKYSVNGPEGATPAQALAILQQHLGGEKTQEPSAPKGALANAIAPITSLPSTYSGMVNEAVGQMREGAQRVGAGIQEMRGGNYRLGFGGIARGAGEAALGAAGYVGAPVNAPIHTIVGKPISDFVTAETGSQRAGNIVGNAAELGASFVVPIPKGIPRGAAGVERVASSEIPTADALKTIAKAGFKSPEIAKLELHPTPVKNWKEILTDELNNEGIDDTLAPKTFGVLKRLDQIPKGGFVTGQNLQSLRRAFGRAAGTIDPTEGAAALLAINHLDRFVETLPSKVVRVGDSAAAAAIWKDARGNYAAAKRSERISEAAERAGRQADAANSGMNIGNATRQRIKSILDSPKARRGFSDAELDQMRQIVKGSFSGNVTRRVGNLLGGGGGLGAVAAGALGAATGFAAHGLSGAAVGEVLAPAIGYGMKRISNAITAKEVDNLDKLIRSRSPLAAQMQAPLKKWGEASAAYEASPTAKNIARLIVVSRNLSKNLEDVGINTNPDKLIESGAGVDGDKDEGPRQLTVHPGTAGRQ